MAIDKSRTPTWMKAVLIGLALVFVLGFWRIASSPLSLFGPQQGTTQTADAASSIDQEFQGTAGSLTQQLQSDPESYTVLVALGNTYFDWAAKLQAVGATNTAVAGSDQPVWIAAKDAYGRAVAVKGDESPVLVDYAITTFYTGDTNKAIEIARGVTKSDPKFGQAWFNLGIFYGALGDTKAAIAAFEQAVKIDPNGQQVNIQYAKDQLEKLKSGGATTTP